MQIGNDAAKLYTFEQIYDAIKNMSLSASITTGKSGLPTLLINDDQGQPLIQYRVKQEFKSDGSPYIRNYVEKQKGLSTIIGENLMMLEPEYYLVTKEDPLKPIKDDAKGLSMPRKLKLGPSYYVESEMFVRKSKDFRDRPYNVRRCRLGCCYQLRHLHIIL